MRNQLPEKIEILEDQPRGFILTIHGRTVTAEDFLFFDSDRRGRKLNLHKRIVLREQQHTAAWPRNFQRNGNEFRFGDSEEDGVGTDAVFLAVPEAKLVPVALEIARK